jgi:hypothetical protein
MPVMIVEARVVGGRDRLEDTHVPVEPGAHRLETVLQALVRAELTAFEQRQRERSVLRVLTPTDLVRGVESGKYAAEPRPRQKAPAYDEAWARAREAFLDGLYVVFLDERQVESLDDTILVTADTRLRLVRLVALAGG